MSLWSRDKRLGPDQRHEIAHDLQLLGVPIGYFNSELVFQRHDGLDRTAGA